MKATWEDLNRTFVVTNTGHDTEDWICRVIEWEGQLYIRHEVGEYAGNITPAKNFCFTDCEWIDTKPPSALSRAVKIVQESKDLDLQFEDLTDYYWEFNGDSITYSDLIIDILDDTGNAMCLDVRYEQDSDANYIRFYVGNDFGDTYDVVFDKLKQVELE